MRFLAIICFALNTELGEYCVDGCVTTRNDAEFLTYPMKPLNEGI